VDEPDLGSWVQQNCPPESRWHWRSKSKTGRPVIIELWGYKYTRENADYPYDLQVEHLWVVDRDGIENLYGYGSLNNVKLPRWFLQEQGGRAPGLIRCDVFKQLVDEGRISLET
jgi:hypothetical protein